MKTDYSLLENHNHQTFKDSLFAGVVKDVIEKLEIPEERNCSIFIQSRTDNPDTVGLCCRDLDIKSLCQGTPDYGTFRLTREAHDNYNTDVSDPAVVRDLKTLEEFLFIVKKACK